MATPAKLAQGSTPKSAAVLTPSNITSSPHASHSAPPPPKGISHKSPAIKTPSSLGHGHAHTLSASSHPSSTPLAAMMSGEDPMAFNSPATAAVMAQLGSRGLTPLAGGNDGLGISSDEIGLKTTPNVVTRNPEEERLQRLRQTIDDLKPKVARQGICREGIESLGPIAGFAPFWQEDTLTIAGEHLVDLEIEFNSAKSDIVKDVSLKIGAPGSPEAARNDAASRVLKDNLSNSSPYDSEAPWRDLREFAGNLERLGNLDRLSRVVNCFKALEGLEECFMKVWMAEQKYKQSQDPLTILSLGSIGRPLLHTGNTIGLGLEYWATRRKFIEARSQRKAEAVVEMDTSGSAKPSESSPTTFWTARIDCEAGFPPLHVSKGWVGDEVLIPANVETENSEMPSFQPAWLDPQVTSADAMIIDPLNVRFVAKLDPSIHLPVMTVNSVFDQTLAGPWIQKPVRPLETILSEKNASRSTSSDPPPDANADLSLTKKPALWRKAVASVDDTGGLRNEIYEYRLKSDHNMWCYSVDSIPFEHPRQITQLFPVFRQYALLWTLITSVGHAPNDRAVSNFEKKERSAPQSLRRDGVRKSNKTNSSYAKLDEILRKRDKSSNDKVEPSMTVRKLHVVDVNIRLSTEAPQQPCVDLFFSPPHPRNATKILSVTHPRSCLISIEIGLNGHLIIENVENSPGLATDIMRKKMVEILSLSEDLTVLVAWILQQQASSAGGISCMQGGAVFEKDLQWSSAAPDFTIRENARQPRRRHEPELSVK